MELKRFHECAAAFGAERRRWPERERTLYDHLGATPEGAAILAEAERADGFLDAFEPSAPSDPHLAHRIVAAARPAWRRFGVPAAAFAASAMIGFALGFSQARSEVEADLGGLLLGPQSLQELGL